MSEHKITLEGFKLLEDKLKELRREREDTIERRNIAKGFGDLKENSEYSEANQRLNSIEAEIAEYEHQLTTSQVFSKLEPVDYISFGAVVTIDKGNNLKETYCILGDYEADIDRKIISYNSPIAKSMYGCRKGEAFTAPNGKQFLIVDFYYPENYNEFYSPTVPNIDDL